MSTAEHTSTDDVRRLAAALEAATDGDAVLPLLGLLAGARGACGGVLSAVCELAYLSGDLRTADAVGARALRLPAAEHDRARAAWWWARAAAARGDTEAAAAALAGAGPPGDPEFRAAAVFVALSRGDPDAVGHDHCAAPAMVTATPRDLLAGADLVECLMRSGRGRAARRALARVAAAANADRGDLARGLLARGRGLIDDDFAPHLQESVLLLGRAGCRFERTRSALVLGMRLRRARRRADATAVLVRVRAEFADLGAMAWTAQTDDELAPLTGRRLAGGEGGLTPRELQVARAAASGATSREIAGRLYISEKTVERHLGVVYRTLGIRRRVELAVLLASGT